MHIVLANQWYPPESGWGGVAMWNYAMARALRARGHAVTVITARTGGAGAETETRGGVELRRLRAQSHYRLGQVPGLGHYARPLGQLLYARKVAAALRALHRAKPIDVVEFADVNAEGYFYARRPDAAVVVRCHTPTFVLRRYYDASEMRYDTRLIGACEREVIRRAHGLTAPSNDMARVIAEDTGVAPERIAVVPNALPKEFSIADCRLPIAPPTLRPSDTLTILHVGRLERVKGVSVLSRAIPQVVERVPQARFVFVGDDLRTARGTGQRAELERELELAGARGQVEFLGGVDHAELLGLYTRADVCVVPTLNYESFSYTCAQAMAAGKPVVASRIGGIPETVGDGVCGILTRPGDAEQLADALVALLKDERQRAAMGAAGRERALRLFDADRVAKRVETVYEQARQTYAQTAQRGMVPKA